MGLLLEKICQTLSKILLKKNYITAIANNSDTALDLLKNSSFNLILLDVWLEGSKKNGWKKNGSKKNGRKNMCKNWVFSIKDHGLFSLKFLLEELAELKL